MKLIKHLSRFALIKYTTRESQLGHFVHYIFGRIARSASSPLSGGECFNSEGSDSVTDIYVILFLSFMLPLQKNVSKRVKFSSFLQCASASNRPHYMPGRSMA